MQLHMRATTFVYIIPWFCCSHLFFDMEGSNQFLGNKTCPIRKA